MHLFHKMWNYQFTKKNFRYKKFETSYHINLGGAAPKLVDLAFFPHAQLFVDDCQLILSHGSSFFPSCAAFCWCLSADYITRSNLIGNTRTSNLPSTSYRGEVRRHSQTYWFEHKNYLLQKSLFMWPKHWKIVSEFSTQEYVLSSRLFLPNLLIILVH